MKAPVVATVMVFVVPAPMKLLVAALAMLLVLPPPMAEPCALA